MVTAPAVPRPGRPGRPRGGPSVGGTPTAAARVLAAAVTAGTPELPGAACTQDPRLFDPRRAERYAGGEKPDTAAQRHAAAAAICHRCPVLHACRRWLDTVPRNRRPTGIVAGRLIEK